MIFDQKISSFETRLADRYAYLGFHQFATPLPFLEDNLGYYVGVFPMRNSERGYVRMNQREGIAILEGRFGVVWRLPEITAQIAAATIRETLFLGEIISSTFDMELFYMTMSEEPLDHPVGEIPFVAHEVVIKDAITIGKIDCTCLLSCYTG